jgi:hypothetical protein
VPHCRLTRDLDSLSAAESPVYKVRTRVTKCGASSCTGDSYRENLRIVREPTTLQDLAEIAVQRHKLSGRRLASIAQDHGFQLTSTTFNQIRSNTYKSRPITDTLRALAWLAGVHEETAFQVAGAVRPGPPFAQELPPGVDNLSPRSRRAAVEMLRALVAAEQGIDERPRTSSSFVGGSRHRG